MYWLIIQRQKYTCDITNIFLMTMTRMSYVSILKQSKAVVESQILKLHSLGLKPNPPTYQLQDPP